MCVTFECWVCYQVEVSTTGRSLVQRSTTVCGVSECDLETSTMRRYRPARLSRDEEKYLPEISTNSFLNDIHLRGENVFNTRPPKV